MTEPPPPIPLISDRKAIEILRTIVAVIAMLTVAPLLAGEMVVCVASENFGNPLNPLNALGLAIFGLLTVIIWPLYLPAIVATPIVFRCLAERPTFPTMPIMRFASVAVLSGMTAGVVVLSPLILFSLQDATTATAWLAAGAVSGGGTCLLIALMYRFSANHQNETDEVITKSGP